MPKPDFYDNDPKYDYTKYWNGRDYENAAEEMAINSLLSGHQFNSAVDIGGGYGRLCKLLQRYATKVTLVEPSKKQRQLGADFLKDTDVAIQDGTSTKTGLRPKSVELITMIRVMHHLPKPTETFKELHRVLADDGLIVLEVANSLNAKSRLRRLLKLRRTPLDPVDIKTESTTDIDYETPFVNHHPKRIKTQLQDAGFTITGSRSASNFRMPALKRVVPMKALLMLEKPCQKLLAPCSFGPSMFYLLKKTD
jgi:ubiquinone/menaquinone biosynthesis C-methylase UbiE